MERYNKKVTYLARGELMERQKVLNFGELFHFPFLNPKLGVRRIGI